MAREIKRGETLLIPFRNGQSLTDSQLRPRIYKTMQALENSLHFIDDYEIAEYVEQKRGRWGDDSCVWKCNQCRKWLMVEDGTANMNYCPHCGAKMDGD